VETPGVRQRAVTAVAGAAQIGTGILMGTVMAVYVGREGSPLAVGLVTTSYFLGLVVFAPVWGAIADITGRRRAVLVGVSGLATLCVLPLSVIDGVWGPIGVRALYSVFAAGFLPVVLTVVSERGGATGRGRSIGSFNSARSVGFTGARFFSGVLLGALAPGSVYLVVAGVSFTAMVAAAFIDDPTPDRDAEPTLTELVAEIRDRLLPSVGDRDHLTTNGLQWLYVALALRNLSWLGLASLLPIFLIAEVGASEFAMGLLLALAPVVEVAGMYAFGWVADAVGRKPLVTAGIASHVLIGVLMAAATLPADPLLGQVTAGTAMVLKGVGFSAMVAGTVAFIGDVAPVDRESELMGLRSTAKGVGGVLGPLVIGSIATVASYETAFVVSSLVAVVGTGIVWRLLTESHPDASLDRALSPGDD
jgi:MFS family permease